ncbi:MAG: UDP-N-acetylmuramate--L-alanine ligase [Flavobacteriales bacterium]|nr:UDP-N-acetylmuramate--L-alanine ligase [Flavobacteriales bacterium]
MKLDQIHNIYFLGIGGIGMSALARYFKRLGKNVAGYDKTQTDLTQIMEEEGIPIHYDDDVELIPVKFFEKENTIVVITPAIPTNQEEWAFFKKNAYTIKKRAEVLGIITADTYCFAVAGTHGKTTTSTILGHLLYDAGVDVTAFVGGISENYGTNLIGSGKTVTVVEADEFDRSFMQLSPDKACITSMDADHLDIYGDEQAIRSTFIDFAAKIKNPNDLYVAEGLELKGVNVGVENGGDYSISDIEIIDGHYSFTINTPLERIPNVTFSLPGKHNLSNALMAFAMAYDYGVSAEKLVRALATFKGIQRRFSYQIKSDKLVYIDDYAHHPTEIQAVYQAIRSLYPNKRNKVVFQPHLFSRTQDFMDGFAASLAQFDSVDLLEIYPARELPIKGVTSQALLHKIDNPNKRLLTKEDLISSLKDRDYDVLITLGAGDIGAMVNNIKILLNETI